MATFQKPKLDKQYLLENSDEGFDFYEFVIEDLKKVDSYRCENVHSPFYADGKPSLSIYFRNEMWRYKDFGDITYEGDVFSFAAHFYELDIKKDFYKILRQMYRDLKIDIPTNDIELDDIIFEIGYELPGKPFNDPSGVRRAHEYFKQFGISEKIVKQFRVRAITSYYFVKKDGEIGHWKFKKDELCIAYESINHVKLYKPGAADFKFLYLGSKPLDYVFGQDVIIRDMIRTKRYERDLLIIAAGEKDVMTLAGLGYDAISLNSETAASIPAQLENSIINCYKRIMVLYDCDKTGLISGLTLSHKYCFKNCILPSELKMKGGKDVSDYITLGLDKEKLHERIREFANVTVEIYDLATRRIAKYITQGYRANNGEFVNQPLKVRKVNEDKSTFENNGKGTNETEVEIGYAEDIDEHLEDDLEHQEIMSTTNPNENKANSITEKEIVNPTINKENSGFLFDDQPHNFNKEQLNAEDFKNASGSPYFSAKIFDSLPKILKKLCNAFNDQRDKDLVLLSSIGVISSLFPNVLGYYDGDEIGTNIYVFISAPAASGKGVINKTRNLGQAIQRKVKQKYVAEQLIFKQRLREYQAGVKKDPSLVEPTEPVQKSIFIPANTSVSKIIEMIGCNKNFGLIFETEGDTLANALKNDWGDFSDILRSAFHHETISMARRGDDEHIEIERPHLSVVLSGTPNQVENVIGSVENGFFSRFFFYDFECAPVWKNQFSYHGNYLKNLFEDASSYLKDVWDIHEGRRNTVIEFQADHQQRLNVYFENKLKELYSGYGPDIVASINRACLICYRVAMILTTLRVLETDKILPAKLCIDEIDYNIALSLVDTGLVHLGRVFNRFRRTSLTKKLNHQQRLVFESIPNEFTRKQYDAIIADLGIEYKTGEKYLGDFKKQDLIISIKHGHYQKV